VAEFYADELVTLLHGDCVEVMAGMDAESVDAIVTDPPYNLGFMGKEWDSRHQHEPWSREAYRVAKPGAHLLAFGGTRTYHRLTSAIEDAGWEIRDCLVWAYASGFPKSLDVSKAIDKAAGVTERPITGEKLGADRLRNQTVDGERDGDGRWGDEVGRDPFTRGAVTDAAKRWQGWGTALKPAWEPIVMARKPLIGTVAANVAAHGPGALNIDGTRIPGGVNGWESPRGGIWSTDSAAKSDLVQHDGRWPPNLLLTDPLFDGGVDGVVGGGTVKAGVAVNRNRPAERSTYEATGYEIRLGPSDDMGYGDTGTYSRFFLVPKSSRSDREPKVYPDGHDRTKRFSTHPTQKPTELMRHLVRLVTPPGGVILDCFLGSGTTAIAANMEGFRCIGIEREAEYLEISRARLAHQRIGMGL
jgi:site-specific DNA-methyltransferase (adenine-specific)